MNVSAAARRLHVSSADLRSLMAVSPDLLALAAEKEERRLDKAEAILDRELASDSAAAAFFCLRHAKRAVARGWRQPDVEITVENQAPARTYVFRWEGDDLCETVMERDGKRIPVPRYDRGDDCLDGEATPQPVLIEHAPEPEVVLLKHEPEPPSLPVWPGPHAPPPLVARLYAPYSPPPPMISGGRREEPRGLQSFDDGGASRSLGTRRASRSTSLARRANKTSTFLRNMSWLTLGLRRFRAGRYLARAPRLRVPQGDR
jgi:hypothetical protein